jgi:hypothetical protein
MTAIAAFRTMHQIVIATDSGQLHLNGNRAPDINKIIDIGNGVFGVTSGLVSYTPTGLSVRDLVKTIRTPVVQAAVTAAENLIGPPLKNTFEYMRDCDPDNFKSSSALGMSLIVAGLQSGTPVMVHLVFSVELQPFRLRSEQQIYPICMPIERAARFVGTPEGCKLYSDDWHANNLNGRTVVEFARDFIQMEIDRGRPSIGPPINILQITVEDGPKWIQ